MAKYCQRSHVVARKIQGCQSFIWKELLRIKADVEPHILWRINEAKISFWWDNWTGIGPLALHHQSENNPGTLMRVEIGQRNKKDQAIWTVNSPGNFTCASTFQVLRKRLPEARIWKCIWNKGIPFKMAFISWRIIKNKLPTYDRIKNYSSNADPMCICCTHPEEETIHHVFIEGELAKKIWKFFGDSLGITTQNQSIQARFTTWWNFNTQNSMLRVAYQYIPIFICWELWKAWSSWKYGNKKYSVAKIYYEVAQHMPITRANLRKMSSRSTPMEAMAHSNKARMEELPRDYRGISLWLFLKLYNFVPTTVRKSGAASFGINWIDHNDINNNIIEVDSMLVVKWLDGTYDIPWELLKEVLAMKRIIDKRNIKVQRVSWKQTR
ncbi:uncharacterized protein LOC132034912 [Lycium ferocissimum]|uniref:uncharacterized protein LOC132034912 n=1 Tax=Lycium ferocissimum TaxID=112874 RepID=UPI00281651B8|nr:uncharacterized protein LOC132034912 [Lycium ferocissimum]